MIRAALFAICVSGPAVACPTSADLEAGILFHVGKPGQQSRSIVRRVEGDLVWSSQVSRMFPDAWSTLSHGGFFTLHTRRKSGSGESVTTGPDPLPDMAQFLAEGSFTTQRRWGPPDGSQVWEGERIYTVHAAEPVDLGGCVYDSVRIEETGMITYPDGKQQQQSRSHRYVPELAYTLGFSAVYKIEVAGWMDGVVSDRDLRKRARWVPDMRRVLEAYGVMK